ncbi:uncharacterized protein B4U80_07167, partial [Leptotrombidium deliense]
MKTVVFLINFVFTFTLNELRNSNKSSIIEFSLVNSETLFVELILVNDNRVYKLQNNNYSQVLQWNEKVVAGVNSLYRNLNIIVVLVDTIVWHDGDQINITSNGGKLLNNFLSYKRHLNWTTHDVAFLITGIDIDTELNGEAMKGTICETQFSGGIIRFENNIELATSLLAHELGHSFGMEHDHIHCACLINNSCVMQEKISRTENKVWSNCSHKFIDNFKRELSFTCLRNKPRFRNEAFCGNGVIEEGEECDCDQLACSRCCNEKCALKDGAKCATGICCDLKTCNVTSSKTLCRKAFDECDLNEYCNGKSEFCPVDKFIHNGYRCVDGYCFDGRCNSKRNQC